MITLVIAIYLFFLVVIYMGSDALHDSWVHKDKSYNAVSKNPTVSDEVRKNAKRLSKIFSRQWHALDAFIKGFMIANVMFWIQKYYGFTGFDQTQWLGVDWYGWFIISVTGIWVISIRWLWFDACWNWFSGLSFWYRGTVAQSDTLKISDWLFFTLKIAGFVGSSVVIVLLVI